jgi:outer membrane protein OmpA-like peptidoglycan-associated protein
MIKGIYIFFALMLYSLLLCDTLFAAKTDTASVFFDYKISEMSGGGKHFIDSLLLRFPNLNDVKIMGYADYVGGTAYNKTLSTKRAQAVRQYLITKGIPAHDIAICAGKGKVLHAADTTQLGYAPDRKVIIIYSTKAKDLNKLRKNETIVMENILFFAGSHHYTQASVKTVQDLIETLKKYPKIKLQIEGHICCETELQQKYRTASGDSTSKFVDGYDYDSQTLELSVNRAKEVYQKLVEGGIDSTKLAYKGFGATKKLINPEKNEDDKNKNRRVELRILAN